MFSALFKAFGQLSDPRLARVLKWGIAAALGSYVLLIVIIWTTLSKVSLFADYWADLGADLAVGGLSMVLPLLFFPALATAFMGPMLDGAVDAVEQRHYPHLPPARVMPNAQVILGALRFLGLTILVNLIALPVYIMLLFTGLTAVLAVLVNGYLLGREYFELAALRRLDPPAARLVFKANLGKIWLSGAFISFVFSVPLLNLAAPVLAAAFMTHVTHSLQPQTKSL
jgi:CysZ protein